MIGGFGLGIGEFLFGSGLFGSGMGPGGLGDPTGLDPGFEAGGNFGFFCFDGFFAGDVFGAGFFAEGCFGFDAGAGVCVVDPVCPPEETVALCAG